MSDRARQRRDRLTESHLCQLIAAIESREREATVCTRVD
jgi:hypothetical protein